MTAVEHRGDGHVDEPYEVFAPRVLAGIDSLEETLEDRSLSVFMLRKRRAEPVSPIGCATDADAGRLREQCALACLTHSGGIVAAYEGAPAALQREGIDDRAVDLWSPLVALATVADTEDRGKRLPEVLAAAVSPVDAELAGRRLSVAPRARRTRLPPVEVRHMARAPGTPGRCPSRPAASG